MLASTRSPGAPVGMLLQVDTMSHLLSLTMLIFHAVPLSVLLSSSVPPCYMLSWGSPDPEFGFGWVRSSRGRGKDGRGFSEQVAVLTLLLGPVFSYRWWHIVGCDSEVSDWTKGDDDEWRSSMTEFTAVMFYN